MKPFLLLLAIVASACSVAQINPALKSSVTKFSTKDGDIYGTHKTFIQNVGQYDALSTNYSTGKVFFGYEGLGMPVLFTPSGLVHVQRKHIRATHSEEEKKEGEEEKERSTAIEKTVTMQWVGANPSPEIKHETQSPHHFSYGLLPTKANGFKKILYNSIYPGIHLQYSFNDLHKPGFEFSITVQPGTDINLLKFNYSGQDKVQLQKDEHGNLLVQSSIETIILSAPKAFYAGDDSKTVAVSFKISGNDVQFYFPEGYDKSKTLVIDPFVSNTATLTGTHTTIAKDIDFDYEGNIYVCGGGNVSVYMLAKYNASGVLQWTFNGGPITITGAPSWSFGLNYGGFVVDKTSGKIYLSQGWSTNGGVRVARLSTLGVYDNFITTANPVFTEGWRLIWDCNNGTARMLVAGGGSTSNLDFGILSPPSVSLTTQNITGLGSFSQDIADAVIDPRSHELYTIFAAGYVPPINMYKHATPYTVVNKLWEKTSGLHTVLRERSNRPYLNAGGNDNSINALALSSAYLFYYDGKNLKAFDKATGNTVGAPLTIANDTLLYQGGIIADECGNVFVGSKNGVIKVYSFDGNDFNDAAVPDISVAGFNNTYNSVYDLAYDDARRILYASGRGFVASFDVVGYCAQATYNINVVKNCNALSVAATLTPAPPAGSTLIYSLYNNGVEINNNTTGAFSNLVLGTIYTIKAFVNQNCSGVQTTADFTMSGPQLSKARTASCGSNGSFTITPSNGTAPYSYSIDGISFQTANVFSNLTPATYTVTVRDALGCVKNDTIIVTTGINCVSATAVAVDEKCGLVNGSITVTALNGMPPYTYSINGGNFQSNNLFSNLTGGNYTITVKDSTRGTYNLVATVNVVNSNNLALNYSATNASCSNNNGSITASGTGGVPPFQFSLNGGVYQNSGQFLNLNAGNFILAIRDANGCIFTQPAVVALTNNLTVDAGAATTICEGTTTVLNATSNGNNFLWSNAATLTNATALQTNGRPTVTTNYTITARWGPCTAIDSVTITVNAAPKPFAADTSICFGQSTSLNAGGGSSYTWSPSTYLNDPTISNPQVINPSATIAYTLNAIGANNCSSIQPAIVRVTVTYPIRIFAGNDTVALENEPIQLKAVDFNNNPVVNWSWSPSVDLSNPSIPNPVFASDKDKSYLLTATTPAGCKSLDSINIKVYKFADIFVPTAFTPNADGKNDVLKALPVGIKKFNRFSVYNRWGQNIFTTTDERKGWNGKINGELQPTGVYVWIASAVDFKGVPLERKGTTVLMR